MRSSRRPASSPSSARPLKGAHQRARLAVPQDDGAVVDAGHREGEHPALHRPPEGGGAGALLAEGDDDRHAVDDVVHHVVVLDDPPGVGARPALEEHAEDGVLIAQVRGRSRRPQLGAVQRRACLGDVLPADAIGNTIRGFEEDGPCRQPQDGQGQQHGPRIQNWNLTPNWRLRACQLGAVRGDAAGVRVVVARHADGGVGVAQVDVVEDVDRLDAQLQVRPVREVEPLEERGVHVPEARARSGTPRSMSPKVPRAGRPKALPGEPMGVALNQRSWLPPPSLMSPMTFGPVGAGVAVLAGVAVVDVEVLAAGEVGGRR